MFDDSPTTNIVAFNACVYNSLVEQKLICFDTLIGFFFAFYFVVESNI